MASEFSLDLSTMLKDLMTCRLMELSCLGHCYRRLVMISDPSPFLLFELNKLYKSFYRKIAELESKFDAFWNRFHYFQFRFLVYNYGRLALLNNVKYLWNRSVEMKTKGNDISKAAKVMQFAEISCDLYLQAWKCQPDRVQDLIHDHTDLYPMQIKKDNQIIENTKNQSFLGWLIGWKSEKSYSPTTTSTKNDCIDICYSTVEKNLESKVNIYSTYSMHRPILYDISPHQESLLFCTESWIHEIKQYNRNLKQLVDAELVEMVGLSVLELHDEEDGSTDDTFTLFWNKLLSSTDLFAQKQQNSISSNDKRVLPFFSLIL